MSKPATKHHLRTRTKKQYEKEFQESLRYKRVTRFDLKAPLSNFRKLTMKLTRQQASILVQLHTSHVPDAGIFAPL